MGLIQDIWEERKTIVDSLVGGLNDLVDVAENIKTDFNTIDDGVDERLSGYAKSLIRYYDNITGFWTKLWNDNEVVNTCKKVLTPVIDCLPSDIKFDDEGYPMILDTAKDILTNLGSKYIKKIPELLPSLGVPDPDGPDQPKSNTSWFGDLVHKLNDYIPPSINGVIPQAWKDSFTYIAEGAVARGMDKSHELLDKAIDLVGGKADNLLGRFVDVGSFVQLGKNAINSMFTGGSGGGMSPLTTEKAGGITSKTGNPDYESMAPLDYPLSNWTTVRVKIVHTFGSTQTDAGRNEMAFAVSMSSYIYRDIFFGSISFGESSTNGSSALWFNGESTRRFIDDVGYIFGGVSVDLEYVTIPVLCDMGKGFGFATSLIFSLNDGIVSVDIVNPFPSAEGMLLIANHVAYNFILPIGDVIDEELAGSDNKKLTWYSYLKGKSEELTHKDVYSSLCFRSYTGSLSNSFTELGKAHIGDVMYTGRRLPDSNLNGQAQLIGCRWKNKDISQINNNSTGILHVGNANQIGFIISDDFPYEEDDDGGYVLDPYVCIGNIENYGYSYMSRINFGEEVYKKENFECFISLRVLFTEGFIQYEFEMDHTKILPPTSGKMKVLPAGEIPLTYAPSKDLIVPLTTLSYLIIQKDGCITLTSSEPADTKVCWGNAGLRYSVIWPSFSIVKKVQIQSKAIASNREGKLAKQKIFKILEDSGNIIYSWEGISVNEFQIDYKDGIAVACAYDLLNLRRPLCGPLSAGEGPKVTTREQIQDIIDNIDNVKIKLADGTILRPISIIENKTESYTGTVLSGTFNFYCLVCDFVWSWSIIKWIGENARRVRDNVLNLADEWKGKSFLDYFHAIKVHMDDILNIAKVILNVVSRMKNEIQAGTLGTTARDYARESIRGVWSNYGQQAVGQGMFYVREKMNSYMEQGADVALNKGTQLLKDQVQLYSTRISNLGTPVLSTMSANVSELAGVAIDIAQSKLTELTQIGINKVNKSLDEGMNQLINVIT